MRIRCQTKFDITSTGIKNNFAKKAGTSWHKARNQQRNWETINQVISLRALPENISIPTKVETPGHSAWEFEFDIEQAGSLELNDDAVGLLKIDCKDVPMLIGLDEDPGISGLLIYDTNIFFEQIPTK